MNSIRAATPADAQTLARLRYRFRTELGEPIEAEEAFVDRCANWMADRLEANCQWICWVAEQSSGIVGNLWLQVMEKLPNPVSEPEHHAYITNVYVLPDCRNDGVGALLMDAALEWCRNSGIDAVFLWPTERSRSFYMRYGFSARDDLFAVRPVSGTPPPLPMERTDAYADAEAVIRRHCEKEWPDDFSMRAYCIEEQQKALAELKRGRPDDIPEDVFEMIRSKCAEEWPEDFSMRQYSEEEQMNAYRKLQRGR